MLTCEARLIHSGERISEFRSIIYAALANNTHPILLHGDLRGQTWSGTVIPNPLGIGRQAAHKEGRVPPPALDRQTSPCGQVKVKTFRHDFGSLRMGRTYVS
jgi:hypothetical protein